MTGRANTPRGPLVDACVIDAICNNFWMLLPPRVNKATASQCPRSSRLRKPSLYGSHRSSNTIFPRNIKISMTPVYSSSSVGARGVSTAQTNTHENHRSYTHNYHTDQMQAHYIYPNMRAAFQQKS
ncbi:uncharacterized protein EI90DRAFT_1998669 [Cantharellus anzutake]|uniref:uncharacterized protein n=1 Tax=Cantharellus anzutake TaxID=1750568 RepID=UPI001904004B|nr:uncharacterized protein EI90DRAFT_1998669 [Cantharellus anzutake]KAF8326108.1 hypothetical protein EI90DRAFT_1998669 [Cantharellus anzutake]